jgi:hypothetical protein
MPGSVTGSLEGVDAMGLLLDTEHRIIYRNGPSAEPVSGFTPVPERNGLFWASWIAADICAAVGLPLAWQCPDYLVNDKFEGVGRRHDLLVNLVRPFGGFDARLEPIKTDVFVGPGPTVICRQRSLRPVADDAHTVLVSRELTQGFELTRFKTATIGLVQLTGMAIPEEPPAP